MTQAVRKIDRLEDPWEMMVYRALWKAAQNGEDCPTCDDLVDLIGCSAISVTVEIIHKLEAAGKIQVRRYQRSRQVFVVALGKWTREPANKALPWRRRQAVTLSDLRSDYPDETMELQLQADKRGIPLPDYLRELIWAGWRAIQANPVQE